MASSFAIAVIARLIALAMAAVVGRQLGPDGFGAFMFALGVGTVAGQLAVLGWPILMMRLIPAYMAAGKWETLRGLISVGDVVAVAGSTVTAVILLILSAIPGIRTELAHGLILAAAVAPSIALRRLRRQQMAALRRAPLGLFYDEALAPLAVVITAAWAAHASAESATLIYAGGGLVGALLASRTMRLSLPDEYWSANPQKTVRRWMRASLPMMGGFVSKLMIDKTDVLLLAPLSTMEQVGAYSAGFRISYVLTFPQIVLGSVMTPRLSEAHALGNHRRLKNQYIGSQCFAMATSIPLASLLSIYSSTIMRAIFGPEFIEAAPLLVILVWGQVAAALSTPCASLLLMTGHERAFFKINTSALLINVVANLSLIPVYGAMGAAYVTAVVMALVWLAQASVAFNILRAR